jgi:hypothetical protein
MVNYGHTAPDLPLGANEPKFSETIKFLVGMKVLFWFHLHYSFFAFVTPWLILYDYWGPDMLIYQLI